MPRDPLDVAATPERLRALARTGALSPEALDRALDIVFAPPTAAAWRRSLSVLLLAVGAILAVSGVVFFFAYNWADMARMAKFALLAALIAAGAFGAFHLGPERFSGQVTLTSAAMLVGALLAVYGQEYQTGADAWGLFVGWAALILPWVLVARFPPLWLIEVLLLDVGLMAFWSQVATPGRILEVAPLLFALNGVAWAAFEVLDHLETPWLMGRWLPRALAVLALGSLGVPAVATIIVPREIGPTGVLALLLLLALLPAVYAYFRLVRRDLLMLTLALTGAMSLFTTFAGRVLFSDLDAEVFGFFLMSLIVLAEVGGAAVWLMREARALREP